MNIGLILIGDELLNGSRQDKHLPAIIARLQQRNLELSWVRMVGDDQAALVATFRQTLASGDTVFSFGGIGATPDDVTRQSAALAADQPLQLHDEASALLVEKFAEDVYPQRIRMAELPRDARLIPNPVNGVPGFSLADHHFVPGFPDMAWPMVEWVLDTYYAEAFGQQRRGEIRWVLQGQAESELIPLMERLLATFQGIKLSCLPDSQHRGTIDFGIKGAEGDLPQAAVWLEAEFAQQEVQFSRT